jgi:hypothetical protein
VGRVVGAPGRVRLPASGESRWQGVGDLPERLGISLEPAAIAGVDIQLVIGEKDSGSEELASVEQIASSASTP